MTRTTTGAARHLLSTAAVLVAALTPVVVIGAPAQAARASCGGLKATIVGNDKANKITGTPKRDVVVAKGGNDVIRGLGGNDVICGGDGADTIYGGDGNDRLSGETDLLRIDQFGRVVKKGDTIVVNYLGQVYDGKKPFDESYSRGTPLTTVIGAGSVIDGWDQGLVGVPVGSRVVLAIPPKLGYGAEGNPGAGIKGTDTLYFVIDVLGAV